MPAADKDEEDRLSELRDFSGLDTQRVHRESIARANAEANMKATKNDERRGQMLQEVQVVQVEHVGGGGLKHAPKAMAVRPVRQTSKPTAKSSCLLGMLFLAAGIVMINRSQCIKQGWGVRAARCTLPNGWHCEFYQHRHKCQIIEGSGISCGDVQEYVPTFSIGGGSLGESGSGSDIGGGISDKFSCSRYQRIEPAELEQCNQTAANLVGIEVACYLDEASDTCLNTWPGPGRRDEAVSTFLLIAGIVVLVICALWCVSCCILGMVDARCTPDGSSPGLPLLCCIVCCWSWSWAASSWASRRSVMRPLTRRRRRAAVCTMDAARLDTQHWA